MMRRAVMTALVALALPAGLLVAPVTQASAAPASMSLAPQFAPYVDVTLTAEGLDPATGTITIPGRGPACVSVTVASTKNAATLAASTGWDDGYPTANAGILISSTDLVFPEFVRQMGLGESQTFQACSDSRARKSFDVDVSDLTVLPLGAPDWVVIPGKRTTFALEVSDAACLPTLSGVVASGKYWSKPEKKDTYYLPELKWTPATAAKVTKATNEYPSCNEPVSVRTGTVTASGAGKGRVVVEDTKCLYKSCTLSYAGRTYNLKDKAVRKSLSCERVSYAPTTQLRGEDYVSDLVRRSYKPETTTWNLVEDADFSEFLCLPVPKANGSYEVRIDQSSPPVTQKGQGWLWRCTSYGYTITCGWFYDGNSTYTESKRTRAKVIVSKTSVAVR